MKILLRWLHEFLPNQPTADEVSRALISVGIEVSACRNQGEGFANVVVAKILEAQRHPNADRLSVCRVTDGTEEREIVCGASNFKPGDRVALALAGAKLPDGTAIKASKIRGVASAGMLCSEVELGLAKESEGILILPPDAPLGKNVAEFLGLDDWLLELELTPNRGDCLSVAGVAREVAAAMNVPPKIPSAAGEGPAEGPVKAAVRDTAGCPRYVLRLVEPVAVGPSPESMRRRLEVCGIRSINNLVDVTNYVLLERGQPMHAFDRDKIAGTIEVRRAAEGEKIACLDDVERTLSSADLVIADEQGPVAIAGVMGGKRTAVSSGTKAILLESAHFDPKSVRITSRRLGLHTESSHRFERWVDPAGAWSASDRAVELYAQVAGGKGVAGIDCMARKPAASKLRLPKSEVTRILGEELKSAGEYLARLGLSVEKTETDWLVEIPTRRPDLTRAIDLVEEAARIHGYDRFASVLPPLAGEIRENEAYGKLEDLRTFCAAFGLREIRAYSFSDETEADSFAASRMGRPVRLLNPLAAGMDRMRRTLLPSLLAACRANLARQAKGVKLFEVGRVYGKADGTLPTPAKEETHLSAVFAGEIVPHSWFEKPRTADFFDGKGFVESLAQQIGLQPLRFEKENLPPYLHPGRGARIVWRGQEIGAVGILHPRLARVFDVKQAVLVDLHLDLFLPSVLQTPKFKPISPFPVMMRDLALVASKEVSAESISAEVAALKEPLFKNISLFDLYEGKGIPENHRSLAYTVSFASGERTLTDEEVDAAVARIVGHLRTKFGVTLRA